MQHHTIALITLLAPLAGSLVAGIGQNRVPQHMADKIATGFLALSFLGALWLADWYIIAGHPQTDSLLYTWLDFPGLTVKLGFWLDALSVLMLVVVTFVSLLVHIYAVGYMQGEKGYSRFFSYMSLFTFMMLTLVMANNLFMLFFGWEGVGLVSYLLIGFYYQKDSATAGGLKAFVVNRVGDMGFIIGIATLVYALGSAQYSDIFQNMDELLGKQVTLTDTWVVQATSVIALGWFIGAMGKSAQIPLHVWLPESMEGPTPISALIHAATMVTAGVYVMCRFAPIFEVAPEVNNAILAVGASGALWLGLVGIVQTDIKRVIAYSTLSQLGYMVAAVGAGAYSLAIFHLATHACFKALLFLAAGSVIIGMHHEQRLEKMGGLHARMPLTGLTFLIGALALSAIPPFAGFFSKEVIISAVGEQANHMATGWYAYVCVMLGAFVTPVYIFRAFWLTFYGEGVHDEVEESPMSILFPLACLALASVLIGLVGAPWLASGTLLYGSIPAVSAFSVGVTDHAMAELQEPWLMAFSSVLHLPLYLSLAGIAITYWYYEKKNHWLRAIPRVFSWAVWALENKLGFDWVIEKSILPLVGCLSKIGAEKIEKKVVDDTVEKRVAGNVYRLGQGSTGLQTGYLSHYLVVMIIGLVVLLWLGTH